LSFWLCLVFEIACLFETVWFLKLIRSWNNLIFWSCYVFETVSLFDECCLFVGSLSFWMC
jgi:hypothetical protein